MTITLDARDVANGGPDWVKEQMLKAGMKPYPYAWKSKGTSIEVMGEPIDENNCPQRTA